jgi:peptidoglycan/xylan/chitin deacetylase (PgdA/CDA1 family)
VLSFDDFSPDNLRIDEILHTQGIEATFFIETARPDAREQIKELFERGHDIGGHTIHHPGDIKLLHHVEAVSEIEGCKKMIENIIHRPITAFAYPRGRFNDDIVSMVKRAGFSEARTTHVLQTRMPDPLRMPTTIHLYPDRKEYKGRDLMALSKFYLDDVIKNGGVFHVWGHAEEINRAGLWKTLEELVVFLGEHIEL